MAIKGSLETIEGPASDDEKAKKKFMKILSEQSSRMESLINDLLILTRIELDEHIRPTSIVNINELFETIISNFEIVLKKKNITVKNQLTDTSIVIGDEKRLNTVFSNLLETIEGPASDDEKAKKKFMKIMTEQSNRMENLINDLLILTRIKLEEHIRPNSLVDINDLFKTIISNFEIILKKKKLNINLSLANPTIVIGDEKKLQTVFSNLLDNAIKYSINSNVL